MNPGVHAAITAAAAEKRKRDQEEERMTRYNPEELETDWEFKIVRSNTPIFRKPEILQRVREEEALAGWQLLEKLDDNRLRFKRPANAARRDAALPPGVDPYRTQVGGNPAAIAIALGVMMFAVLGGILFLFTSRGEVIDGSMPIIIAAIIIFVGIMTMIAVKFRT